MANDVKARGFLLLVLISLLAVMLVLCVSFLSMTRSEVTAVSGLRNRTELTNAVFSGLDYTLGCIIKDSFNGDQFDPSKVIALVRDSNAPLHRQWYRPSADVVDNTGEPGCGHPRDEAKWIYLPKSFTSDGYSRVRMRIQVSDTNGNLNSNDWMEDGSPTQCQMAHMLGDACDDNYGERERAVKLTQYSATAPANGGSIKPASSYPNWVAPNNYNCNGTGHTGYRSTSVLKLCPYHAYPHKPLRYLMSYRMATHTMAFNYNGFLGPWITLNEPYFVDLSIGTDSVTIDRILNSSYVEDGDLPGNLVNQYVFGDGRCAYYPTCYTDPDTGRSPVNVNTGFPSGWWNKSTNAIQWQYYSERIFFDRVMRGVFNVEALRRIVRIGKFYATKKINNPPAPPQTYEITAAQLYEQPLSALVPAAAPLSTWDPADIADARKQVEEYRAKLAYQYQETLVRYFAGFYAQRDCFPIPGYDPRTTKLMNYKNRFNTALGAANSGDGEVKYYCESYDLQKARFPYGLADFREHCKADLTAMAKRNRNPNYADNTNSHGTEPFATNASCKEDDNGFVGVDDRENFEIAYGKLDKRTASAVYDNIIPGSATLWGPEPDDEVKYPLRKLYAMRLARDENGDAQYAFPTPEGPGTIPIGANTLVTRGYPKSISWQKGRDIALANAPGVGSAGNELGPWEARATVPERQLVFGPDWFSTELTTSTTTYSIVVCAQLVDTTSGLATPNILYNRFLGFVVEVAPDILNETAGATDWPNTGLAYYKEGYPRRRLTDRALMDAGLSTRPKGQKDSASVLIPGTDTSAALGWFDFRGIPQGQEQNYYGTAWQTKKGIIIRRIVDFNLPGS